MTEQMNIGFLGARGVPHGHSSTEQVALNVGRRMVERGHRFTVYCRSGMFPDKAPEYQGIRRVFLPTIEHKILGQLIHGSLSGIHAAFRGYDVIHVQCLTNAYQSILPWLVSRNVIINVDGQEWENPKWHKTARHLFFGSAARLAMLISREIITDAEGMRQLYLDRYGRDSTLIEYGAEIVEPRNPAVLEQFGLRAKDYYLVAARLVPSNQVLAVMEAYLAAGAPRTLAVAGGGHDSSEYYRRMREIAGDKVRFLGMVSDQDLMNELYANAFAYLHGASLGGVNSALLRPLGAGCPGLAFDTPFNREVLEMDGGKLCGRLWRTKDELAECIREMETSPGLMDELSRLSVLQIRRNFTWDLVADQYEVFYRGAIGKWPADRIRAEVAAQKLRYREKQPT